MARNGGKLLVESLIALGARTCFGVPGESYLAVLDALHDSTGRLDYVLCRNEGGAAFMASAYGKLTGSPGICFVTRGPGVTNSIAAAFTRSLCNRPGRYRNGSVLTRFGCAKCRWTRLSPSRLEQR